MKIRRSAQQLRMVVAASLVAAAAILSLPVQAGVNRGAGQQLATALPSRLTDVDFWKLVTDISEPGGFFRITDNYTSNEAEVGRMFTMLRERKVTGGAYLGVGPEQNFTYIAATQPDMAFIIDIRRQAVIQHLMFKAMFEMSKDRADFISMLFSKPRPTAVDASMPIQKMWDAFFASVPDATLAAKNRERVVDYLTKTKKFVLTADESAQLDNLLAAFVQFGPGITTRGGGGGGGGNNVSFADLTGWSVDSTGQPQSFMSTEDNFKIVKSLHDKNLIVPVSGDFAGPKALRAIGAYLTRRGGKVNAYYVSNVEQYLFMDGKATAFYENVATLPQTENSVFIRPYGLRRAGSVMSGLCGMTKYLKAAAEGRVTTNNESLSCPQ